MPSALRTAITSRQALDGSASLLGIVGASSPLLPLRVDVVMSSLHNVAVCLLGAAPVVAPRPLG